MKRNILAAGLAACLISAPALATDHSHSHAYHHDDLTPIGVMGTHTHEVGSWMFSYRYMHMDMDGNRDGTDHVSTSRVLKDFMVSPTSMTMDMHMFGAMYAPADNLTLMLMLPYRKNSMDHRTRTGTTFTTESEGAGDISVTGIFRPGTTESGLLLNLGISVPTGSTSKKDDTPLGKVRLPYPMQLGSGTVDLLPGITYTNRNNGVSWGGEARATLRTYKHNGYRLGNSLKIGGWLSHRLSGPWSASVHVNGKAWGDIHGADDKIMQTTPMGVPLVPTADPNLRGGKRLDGLLGLNYRALDGILKNHKFGIEAGMPLFQNLDGPQLETDWTITVGWEYLL